MRQVKPELVTFWVIGPRGAEFPMDMLRFGPCWPADVTAAGAIYQSISPSLMGQNKHSKPEVRLQMVRNDVMLVEIEKRFSSFNWTLMTIEEPEYMR